MPVFKTEAAEQLISAEYFVDSDPGEGLGTPVLVPDDGNFDSGNETIEINISGASHSEGEHKVYVRFKGANGKWGTPKGQVFRVKNDAGFTYSLAKAEYFIDTDPGKGNGTPVTSATDGVFDGNEEDIEVDVNLNNLSDGIHTIFTRFQDNTGKWGAERGFQFNVQSTEDEDVYIQTAEYFINTDPGKGSANVIPAPADGAFDEAVEELEATFTLNGLPVGRHFVYFRVRGSNGKWGPARGVPFQVENITILEKAEYFFNSDPGEGNGTPITAAKDGGFNSVEEEIDLEIPVSETGLDIGQHTMYLRFKNTKGEWSQPVSKEITIQTKPVITVSTDTLHFNEIVVGDSLTKTFTVKNEGDGALNITNITSSSAEFSVNKASGSIPANSANELSFDVQYKPTTSGDKNAVLTIANNDQNKTIRLLSSALADEPAMVLSANSLDYGEVLVGDSVALHIAIYNNGFDTLKLDNISVNSNEFRVSSTSGSLAPGSVLTDSLVLDVAFVPQTEGDKNASLTLSGNVPSKQVSLNGTAKLNPEPTIALSTDSLSFGAVEIGKDSTRILQIRNLGTNTLTLSSVNISGDEFSAEITTPVDIERGSPLNVPVTFSPQNASTFAGTLEINSNDASNEKVTVKFSGEGTVGPPTKLLKIHPDSLNFGLVTQKEVSKQVLTLSNEGNASLKVSVMASDSPHFFIEKAPSPSNSLFIPAGSSEDVEISFMPNEGGNKIFSAQLTISSDRTDSDEADLVAMKGTGVDQPTANVQLSTRKLDFGELKVGEKASLNFNLTNGGNADLKVNALSLSEPVFSVTNPTGYPFSLNAGQQQTVTVEFSPNDVTAYSTKLTIESNLDPVNLELTGTGVVLSAGVDSAAIKSGENLVVSGQSVPININPTGMGSSGQANIYFKPGGGGPVENYTKVAMTKGNSGTFSVSLPSNIVSVNGVSYWFEVIDGAEKVTSPRKDPQLNPYTFVVESSSGIVKSSPQPAGSEQNFYRMITIPLTATSGAVDTVMKNFGEGTEDSWRLFRWQSGKYVEHNENGFEAFTPGRGYWFITTKAASLQTGSGKSARTDEPFSIFLQPGWNMIGSPFTYPISWENAEKSASIENLWSYDGSGFNNAAVLQPWEGYFVTNSSNNPVEIKLNPVEVSSGSGKLTGGNYLSHKADEGWSVHLDVRSGILADRYNYAGIQPEALDELDSFDLKDAPKQPGEFLQLSFNTEEVAPKKLAVDLRAQNKDGHFWDFEIHTNASSPTIDVHADIMGEFPDDFAIRFIDKNQGTTWAYNPEEPKTRTIRTALGDTLTRKFRLLVGTEDFIKSNNLGISDVPEAFVLKHNYPNPFNPSTTIVFGLPEAADVRLEIFDILGRKVATLIDEKMEAGYYNHIWNASRAASGVYFYRIMARGKNTNSKFTHIKKMTLVK